MAHFIGIVEGSRRGVSRLGTKNSGIAVTASGWNIGVHAKITHENGVDVVRVYRSGGSGNPTRKLIAEYGEGTVEKTI